VTSEEMKLAAASIVDVTPQLERARPARKGAIR